MSAIPDTNALSGMADDAVFDLITTLAAAHLRHLVETAPDGQVDMAADVMIPLAVGAFYAAARMFWDFGGVDLTPTDLRRMLEQAAASASAAISDANPPGSYARVVAVGEAKTAVMQ